MKNLLLKIFTCIFVLGACFYLMTTCDCNAPLRNKMLNYYTQESNYQQLTGRIISIKYFDDVDELFIEIDILTENHNFPLNATTGYGEFDIVDWSNYQFLLQEKEIIVFTSAPMYFYNGHILPIVKLEKNNQEFLSLSCGMDNYCNWIKKTFD